MRVTRGSMRVTRGARRGSVVLEGTQGAGVGQNERELILYGTSVVSGATERWRWRWTLQTVLIVNEEQGVVVS